MMHPFTFTTMPQLIFGPGSSASIGVHASTFGRCVLLVTGAESLEKSGQLQQIVTHIRRSGLDMLRCSISGEPSPGAIDASVNEVAGKGVDVVVAVGGGSVLDAGKAIAAMLKEHGPVGDYLEGEGSKKPSGQTLPVIAVPTTSGTGSEATKNAVISRIGDNGFKKSLRHDSYIPNIAILDAELCTPAPPFVTAACGMDALAQLIESYVSINASPLTDALSLDGMRHLIPALPDACGKGAEDLDCRGAVSYGAFLSGVTLAHAGLGVIHGIAGPMGGLIAIPHGVACANLLPSAVSTTVDNLKTSDSERSFTAIEKFARIGRFFGSHCENQLDSCGYLVSILYDWLEQLNIPRLESFGLTHGHVTRLVRIASNKNNPMPLSANQMQAVIMNRY
jgi:alcohol dehydrogenase class IV